MLQSWQRVPILYKVLLGNAVVIMIGAIGGTYITQQLLQASAIELALFFATVGIILSIIINYFILRNALRSIDVLEHTIEQIDRGDTSVRVDVASIDDPQFQHFAQSLNTMLGRLAAHTRMIDANRAQLRKLSGQVLSAQEDERKRIARELHDDTSGSLARVLLNLEMCQELTPEGMYAVREKMSATRILTEQTLENIRKMIFDLRPTLLDDLGLAAAIRWYAKNNLEPAGVQVQLDLANGLRGLPAVETALFRIAQEAIGNIVRHANAQHATIRLTQTSTQWLFVVHDDGRGFDATPAFRDESLTEHRWGLFGVRERVQLLGGSFQIESAQGKGTTLRVEIPITQTG
jgi:two-component system sensor histidine kinase UhpB